MNGIPVHADKRILTDLLRDEMGFKGLAVTDWEDIIYLQSRHRVAKDYKDAIAMAINAGIDMSMVPMDLKFPQLLKELVEEGRVPMSRIDEAVERILTLKYELDLFENPYYNYSDYPDFASKKHRDKSLEAAEESIVMVKNEKNILPLSKEKRILLVGPTATKVQHLNGGWSYTWQGDKEEYYPADAQTILKAFQASGSNVSYAMGSKIDEVEDIKAALNAATVADVIVACLGENTYTEKPGDIDDLTLAKAQRDLIHALAKTGKPIVLIMAQGRPRVISEIEGLADAILIANYPGNEGGRALANICFGDANPSGKLSYTYPRHSHSIWTYDYKGTDMIAPNFSAEAVQPQYEFGFGLSYTSFEYGELKLSSSTLESGDFMQIEIDVKNTGSRTGKEAVQLFVTDKVATITPSAKRLRGFEKIELAAGETKTVKFRIQADDLSFIGVDMKPITEAGEFEVRIGNKMKVFTFVDNMNK